MSEQRPAEPSGTSAGSSLRFLAAASLILAGCGIFEPSDPFAKLEVDGFVELSADGDPVRHTLNARNPTGRDVTLTDSSCNGGVRWEVRAVPSAGGGLVWNSADQLRSAVASNERLVSSAEVLQELLHRHVAIRRRDAIHAEVVRGRAAACARQRPPNASRTADRDPAIGSAGAAGIP